MMYLNDWDLQEARARFGSGNTPNRLALAIVVDNLREMTDEVSDGWAYWQKPRQAAKRAVEHIRPGTYADMMLQEERDITDAAMRSAVTPVRSFLTRHQGIYGAGRIERILRAVDSPTDY